MLCRRPFFRLLPLSPLLIRSLFRSLHTGPVPATWPVTHTQTHTAEATQQTARHHPAPPPANPGLAWIPLLPGLACVGSRPRYRKEYITNGPSPFAHQRNQGLLAPGGRKEAFLTVVLPTHQDYVHFDDDDDTHDISLESKRDFSQANSTALSKERGAFSY